jgi:hypothetical protein
LKGCWQRLPIVDCRLSIAAGVQQLLPLSDQSTISNQQSSIVNRQSAMNGGAPEGCRLSMDRGRSRRTASSIVNRQSTIANEGWSS